tara:strand:- start:1426 stop:1611 length:186 start_codon:yes stop_codon:yes gene_type:complete
LLGRCLGDEQLHCVHAWERLEHKRQDSLSCLRVAEEAGANGMMKNVCRVFNDKVGVVSIII